MLNTVVSKNRLHVANDANYQGSINSYNNGLTKSFTRLFGFSSKITINNERKCVNNKSYQKFLTDTDANGTSVKNFDTLSCSWRRDRGLMRDHISSRKSEKLGRQFIRSILSNNMRQAEVLIGKGAQIDKHFWLRGNRGISFGSMTQGISQHPVSFQAASYTPFLYAISRSDRELKDLLQRYSANERLTGTKWHFQREIVYESSHTTVNPVYYGNGSVGVNISTVKHTAGRDLYTQGERISYNKGTDSLNYQRLPNETQRWSRTDRY